MSIMMNSSFTHSLKIIISKRKKVVNKKIKIFLGATNIECVCARVRVRVRVRVRAREEVQKSVHFGARGARETKSAWRSGPVHNFFSLPVSLSYLCSLTTFVE